MGPASTSTNRATQYAVPAIPSAVLLRPRIVEELTRRIALHAVVEVVGAPGVGKTTAVAQAAAASDRSVAWLTLAEWHREPGRLLDELVDALAAAAPGLRRFRRVAGGDREAILASSARLGASSAFGSPVLLVLDDCHHLVTAPEAAEVLGALVRNRHDNLSIAIVGRDLLPLPELREAGRNDAVVGPDVLDANLDEARAILQLLGSSADAEDALAATGGWLAALAFESWRRPDDRGAGITPLDTYFAAEIRPLLEETIYELLVDTAVFDTVDEDRATALGHAGAGGSLRRLRERGFPATWWADGAEMRVHPRVRELLRAELERRPVAAVQRVITAAAAQYEREGKPERALDLLLQADMPADARRLVPSVIIEIIARGDLPLAERLLALTGSELGDDVEPTIVLARLMLASARQSGIADVLTKLDELPRGRLEQLIVREPILGAYMCMNWVGEGRLSDAVKILDVIPPGRAAAAARLLLSLERDDPEAVAPAFAGDVLDPVVARGMWGRGMLAELREGWYEGIAPAAGLPGFVDPHDARLERAGGTLGAVLTRFRLAVERRDLDEVNATLEAISVRPWIWLSRAEAAVRVARDPESARSAIEDLRASPDWGTCFSRELGQVWEGGALLLAGDDEAAARVLREAVAGMRRGDRTLELPTALVYLAEAEWRLGSEGDADAATHAAFRAAVAHGTLRGLTLALGDFPAVLSRAIDAEPADSEWHALGRLLAGAVLGAGSRTDGPAPLHLRELGDPSLVDRGVTTRPKLKKSLELLSYLLSRPRATASRADVLVALWNGRDDESTRAYLRQVLRNLRECVSDDVAISAVGDTLSVEGPVSSDTGELEALLAEARRQPDESRRELLLRVVDILESGEFFAGSTGVNWIDERRVELRGKLATAYLDLAEVELRAGGYLAALDLVAAALAIDPLLERGWRMRMGAFARLGDARAFASAYAACEDALSSVGLTPSRATTRLFRQLGKEPPPG